MAFLALAQQTVNVLSTLKNLLTTTQTTVRRDRSQEISYSSFATKNEESCAMGIKCERWERYAANLAERLSLSSAETDEVKMFEDCTVEGGSHVKSYGNIDQHASTIAYKYCRIAVTKKYGAMHCAYLAFSSSKKLAPEKVTFTMSKKFLFWECDSYEQTGYIPREITQKHIDEVKEEYSKKIGQMNCTHKPIKAIDFANTVEERQINTREIEAKQIEAKKVEVKAIKARERTVNTHYIMVYDNNGYTCYSRNDPASSALAKLNREKKTISCVAVGPCGRYAVLCEDDEMSMFDSKGMDGFDAAMQKFYHSNIKQITFGPSDQWAVVLHSGGVVGWVSQGMNMAITNHQGDIQYVSMSNDAWIVGYGRNGFAAHNLRADFSQFLKLLRKKKAEILFVEIGRNGHGFVHVRCPVGAFMSAQLPEELSKWWDEVQSGQKNLPRYKISLW